MSIKGEAAQVIQSLEVSETNYTIAWDLLNKRFENTRLIVHNHVQSLFLLPSIARESYTQLRELLDNLLKHLRALENLGQPVNTWDTLIIHLISTKLDTVTKREWETFIANHDHGKLPNLEEFKTFLSKRCQLLETLHPQKATSNNNRPKSVSLISSNSVQCAYCSDKSHLIYKCKAFLELPVNTRIDQIKKKQLCLNCLRHGHIIRECRSTSLCKHCNKKHNSLIHINVVNEAPKSDNNSLPVADNQEISDKPVATYHSAVRRVPSQTLLSTAIVLVKDSCDKIHKCRALLDSGSQSHFISKDLHDKLALPKTRINSVAVGINQSSVNIPYKTEVTIQSQYNSYKTKLSCLIVPKITENMPSYTFSMSQLDIPANIRLADQTFNIESSVDILIGANLFWQLLCTGQIQLGSNKPVLHKTKLGWLISGPLPKQLHNTSINRTVCNLNLETQIEKFWEIEDCSPKQNWSIEEQQCENHFVNTVTHNNSGRFVVKIPLKENKYDLGESRGMALKRFYSLEKRLEQDPTLRQNYNIFMQEYEQLGHMVKINELDTTDDHLTFYFPHHAVIKASSTTTKTRVVFDGSAKTDSGLSFNDIQKVGPVVQNELFQIILRFRKHKYVMTADVEKMYRQILVAPEDRHLQRIFWRTNCAEPVQCYELQTITYGTASAPYLATRCLQQIAVENQSKFPEYCNIICKDFYVDDLLTGSHSIETLIDMREQISNILNSAGFSLRKWLSNSKEIVNFSNNLDTNLSFNENHETKTLGILWNAESDSFHYDIKQFSNHKHVTKRTILSITAQIFDPLGLLGPVTVIAKLMIQKLWQYNLSWDESIPSDLHTQWLKLCNELPMLNKLKIARCVLLEEANEIQLHGFADASERAYGASIYVRSRNSVNNNCAIQLLCAKSRVAPLRQITLPRLELCAAVLLANLMHKVCNSLELEISSIFYWSDSKIVLSWIHAPSSRWQTFVANRVASIQNLSKIENWHHVKSGDNPADLISRGVTPQQLINCSLWWSGPTWLANSEADWPVEQKSMNNLENIPEKRKSEIILTNTIKEFELYSKYSSLKKLIHVFAWCMRFVNNVRSKKDTRLTNKCLTVDELDGALLTLIKNIQNLSFKQEIKDLEKSNMLHPNSKLVSLKPFLDEHKVLRVGGRIKFSSFDYNKKHPIILPDKHALTNLIIKHEHVKNLHCGSQALLASVRERYWPIGGRNLTRKIVRNCVTCFKCNPKAESHLMGDLPTVRLTPSPVFYNCGLDFAGPCLIKDKRSRGNKTSKVYICLFVCLVTKAIHLELVGALTKDAFLSCFRRFISRRGKPRNLYSDNAKNFIGSQSELNDLGKFLNDESVTEQITNSLADEGITWHFIPPRAPHFGGIWEAGIKSTKYHLKRVLGNVSLVFEDLYTVLMQIEAVLNSRPLSPISSDPTDLTPLTPGHFLIGRPILALPEKDLSDLNENRLNQYQKLQRLTQHFWSRWSREYISQLQVRTKWKQNFPTQLKEGSLVIIKEDNLPPLKWQLGRVLHLIRGSDGVARVAEIKTARSNIKRAVNRLCVLPESDNVN